MQEVFQLTLLNENTLKQHRLQGIESNYDSKSQL